MRGSLVIVFAIGGILLVAPCAAAQSAARPELRFGIGTFLTRESGWNYSEPIEVFVSVARNTGPLTIEAGASFYKTFAKFGRPAEFPRRPGAFHDGIGARLHARWPRASASPVGALVGAEVIQNRTDGETRTTTLAATGGVSLSFGPARRASLDFRYVTFAERLGSSRGILPLTLGWRL